MQNFEANRIIELLEIISLGTNQSGGGPTMIPDRSIAGIKLVLDTVTSEEIAPDAITSSELAANSVITTKIADAAVTLAKLASNSVDASKIVDGSITTSEIADAAISLAKLAANSVDSSKIVDGSITTADLANALVTLAKLAPNSVDSSKIVDGSIVNGDIANTTITGAKLVNGTITPTQLDRAYLPIGTTANRATVIPSPVTNQLYGNTQTGFIEVYNGSTWVATTATLIAQGGNSFGAAMIIGTNDNFPVIIETNGAPRLNIDLLASDTVITNLSGRLRFSSPGGGYPLSIGPNGGNEILIGSTGGMALSGTGSQSNITISNANGLAIASANGISLGNGSTTPAFGSCSILELVSGEKGILLPRMTTAQRNAIVSPVTSLLIYNTTTNRLEIRTSSGTWAAFETTGATENLGNGTANFSTFSTRANVENFVYLGGATATMSGNEIVINASGTSVGNIVAWPPMIAHERWTATCRFKAALAITLQDFGIGLTGMGTRGAPKGFIATFDHGTGGTKGRVVLYSTAGGSVSAQATSPSNLAVNANDIIRLELVRNGPTFTLTAFNETQSLSLAPLVYTYPLQTASDPITPSTGRICFYPLQAGNVNLLSFTWSPTSTIGQTKLLVIGDSKTAGYNTTANVDRYTNLLNVAYGNVEVLSGPGDEFPEFTRLLTWIYREKARVVLFAGGCNDVRNGMTDANLYNNLKLVVDACVQAGSIPVFLGMHESSINQANLFQNARALFGNARTIIVNPALAGDGVHLTTAGHLTVYNAIVAQIGSLLA